MASAPSRRRPGRPAASERRPEETREELLDAATAVFARHGYRAATVAEIVSRAKLSKGTFYWHFDSKEDLFAALLDERIDRPTRGLMDVTKSASPDQATAPVVSRGLAELLQEHWQLVLLLHEYWAAAMRDEGLKARYLERQAAVRENLAATLRARHESTGVPITIEAESLATAFIALAEGLSMQALIDPDARDPGLYGEILSLVYDGMVARSKRDA
jgi:AcrR family transcriptional regulator